MKKKSILCLLMAFSLLLMPGTSITANASTKESTEIVLGDTVLETSDYDKSDISISRDLSQKNEGIVIVTIRDKETGRILEVITEKNQSKNNLINSVNSPSGSGNYIYNIRRQRNDGPVTIYLDCTVYMSDSGMYTQINQVLGTNIYISSTCDSTLENAVSYWVVPNNVFPTAEVSFWGSGVTTGKLDTSVEVGYSVEFLKSIGYSVTTTAGTTVYFRKPISMSGTFYTYSTGH
ncbi:hypothetical protein GCM10023142_08940 [Anaerocolumna aminovalerica]|uniref:Uncharacterized protein n=1 Tax=Anaerocolumna aminovalerica TaxID=1527 RepID=A0A1I5DVU0_9FIRM|nr:hypothetical protein [Anaerocolumna aminovalerica]MBU5332853.1 hypothetical protein [Anaerocolumna aminovalerica]SFO03349.1 hypothetical protein SAMN04489757_10716 [Anaerocolumna aminovalerica]